MTSVPQERARRVLTVMLGALAALDLLILVIRIRSVFSAGSLVVIPIEGPGLYAIWKLRHGFALYEWPTQPYFSLTLYNALFYKVYAAAFTILRTPDAATPVVGRLVTLAFAVLGAAVQYATVRTLAPSKPSAGSGGRKRGPIDAVPALIAIITWTGCGLPGWWTLAVRPDVPAAALSMCGMYAAVRAFSAGDRRWLLAAALTFACAWGFKQSHVAIFAATCAYVLFWRRSISELALLVVPFASIAALALVAGGAVYRFNILFAPAINELIPYLAIYWYRNVVLTDLLLWGVCFYALIGWWRTRNPDVTYLAVVTVCSFAIDAVLLSKAGSALNHVLDLNVAAAILCSVVLVRTERLVAPAALMLVPMIAFDLSLLLNDGGMAAKALQLKGWGAPLVLAREPAIEQRRSLATRIAALPIPVYTEDDLFALPWFATGNRYPALVLDHVFFDAARPKGLVGEGVEGLIRDHYFGALVLPASSYLVPPAVSAGYSLADTIPQGGREPLRVLLRARR